MIIPTSTTSSLLRDQWDEAENSNTVITWLFPSVSRPHTKAIQESSATSHLIIMLSLIPKVLGIVCQERVGLPETKHIFLVMSQFYYILFSLYVLYFSCLIALASTYNMVLNMVKWKWICLFCFHKTQLQILFKAKVYYSKERRSKTAEK